MLDEITDQTKKISKLNIQIAVMETDLVALRVEQKTWVGKIDTVNKAREEMKNQVYEQEWEIKNLNSKIKEKDEHIKKITAKLRETDILYNETAKKLHHLEQEKKAGRLDYDNQRKALTERISILDA